MNRFLTMLNLFTVLGAICFSFSSRAESEVVFKSNRHHLDGTLSEFWAQEYTGADLLRLELKSVELKKVNYLVSVVDTKYGHGEWVSSLIANDRAGAALSNISLSHNPGSHISHHAQLEDIINSEFGAIYINESFQWRFDTDILEANKKLSDSGSIIITSAGNCFGRCGDFVKPYKEQASKTHSVIIVAAMNEEGNKDVMSQVGNSVTVTAPGGANIRGYINNNKKSVQAERTSAATPQVTSALASFTEITGYKLNKEEIKKIFEMTSLKLSYADEFEGMVGAGLINIYKIGKVALRLREMCSNDESINSCIHEGINNHNSYLFESEIVLGDVASLWNSCGNSDDGTHENDTDLKRQRLNALRASLLLSPENAEGWALLSCIYGSEGFSVNAKYYSKMAKLYQK